VKGSVCVSPKVAHPYSWRSAATCPELDEERKWLEPRESVEFNLQRVGEDQVYKIVSWLLPEEITRRTPTLSCVLVRNRRRHGARAADLRARPRCG
jgi:hypothetical protein